MSVPSFSQSASKFRYPEGCAVACTVRPPANLEYDLARSFAISRGFFPRRFARRKGALHETSPNPDFAGETWKFTSPESFSSRIVFTFDAISSSKSSKLMAYLLTFLVRVSPLHQVVHRLPLSLPSWWLLILRVRMRFLVRCLFLQPQTLVRQLRYHL